MDPVRPGRRAARRARRLGSITGAAFNGGNLIPVGGAEADWAALAEQVARRPAGAARRSSAGTTRCSALWADLEPRWGPARAVRERQPLLASPRTDPRPVRPDGRLRMMHPDELERYLPAAAAMFAEELGISPFAGHNGATYRRRIEALLATGRAFGIVDDAGDMVFKADIGALTRDTCQLQGVWVRPDLRGQGIGTARPGRGPRARAAARADRRASTSTTTTTPPGGCTPGSACARCRC